MAVLSSVARRAAIGLGAVVLAGIVGCQSTPPPVGRGASVPDPPPEADTAAQAVVEPPAPMAPVPRTKPPAPPTEAQLQALGAADSRPLTTGSVIGLEFEEIRRLLGEPTLALDEPPARIWQYQATECTLRLLFFPEVKTQRYRTLSVRLGNPDEDTEDAKSRCLNAIRNDLQRS